MGKAISFRVLSLPAPKSRQGQIETPCIPHPSCGGPSPTVKRSMRLTGTTRELIKAGQLDFNDPNQRRC